MMYRAQHPSNNDVLGAPQGATIDECTALPITRVKFGDGTPACVSFWCPSPEDLELLKKGHLLRLCVLGTTHAPIAVGVDGDGDMVLGAPQDKAGP